MALKAKVASMIHKSIEKRHAPTEHERQRAGEHLGYLVVKLCAMYGEGAGRPVSEREAERIVASLNYVLGTHKLTENEAVLMLAHNDPDKLFARKQQELAARCNEIRRHCQRICRTMPSLKNEALSETLDSILTMGNCYDTCFSAHELPCKITYQLSEPIDATLQGLDYVEAWLCQLEKEIKFIAQFKTQSCIAILEWVCPDYKDKPVNLYTLLEPHAGELARAA